MNIQTSTPLPGIVSSMLAQRQALPDLAQTNGQAKSANSANSANSSESAKTVDPLELIEQLEKEKETLAQFEGVFVSMLIKEMRQSAKDLFEGDSTDSLGVLFDQHIGDSISEGGGIGIAAQLSRYLEAQQR